MLLGFKGFGFSVQGYIKIGSDVLGSGLFWAIRTYEPFEPSYELLNAVGFAKSSEFVMPYLIRHPEYAEVTGFRPSPE
jgi:hypothetical protein